MAQILLVDDDLICRELLRTLCEEDGHFVLTVPTAEDALSALDRSGMKPDLLITDFNLGRGLNGYQFIKTLRQIEGLARLPALMVTGTTKQIRELTDLEGVRMLGKPFTKAAVVAAVREALAGESAPRSKLEAVSTFSRGGAPPAAEELDLTAETAAREAPGPGATSPADFPVIELVNQIVHKAIQQRASDIHFEPQRDFIMVRTRVDGELQPLGRLPIDILDKLAVRIKLLCNLNITEKRLPQDGQFSVRKPDGQMAKFRVSTLPSAYGEKVVVRLLPAENLQVKLDTLGFSEKNRELIRATVERPTGLILVTGPTGSGKTTTLYTMLDMVNSPQRNLVTVEDPVEYQLPGITQVQVNSAIGFTFERVLRALLRQDPNVILIGEIRDAETAEIALKAAVTGHMVLSTLHTNDAPSAVYRLLSMGLPAYLVAAACRLVISQRLVRLLCPSCKTAGTLTPQEACQLTAAERSMLPKVWRAGGCQACHGLGYSGRRVICELMPLVSHSVHEAIVSQSNPDELRAIAIKEGLVPMRYDAITCAAEGQTSPEEAFKALYL